MEAKAYIKNLKISPKKLRFLRDDIRRKKPDEALAYLLYTPKKGARLFYKAIKSAITNAKQVLKTSEDKLKFSMLTVEEGRKLKRFRAGGRGNAKPYVRRYSHIRIALEVEKPLVEAPSSTETVSSAKKLKKPVASKKNKK